MFGFVRLILGCVVLASVFGMIHKNPLRRISQYFIAVIFVFALVFVSVFLPVENLILTFETPESAYQYVSFGPADVKLVVNGKHSDLVVGYKNGADELLIIPRNEQGYKVGIGTDTREIAQKVVDNVIIQVFQYKNTDDYYLVVANTSSGMVDITDSYESDYIYQESHNKILDEVYFTYYASLPDFDETYWVSINGEVVWLS